MSECKHPTVGLELFQTVEKPNLTKEYYTCVVCKNTVVIRKEPSADDASK